MITVIVKNNNIEKALRQLKKIVKESKLLIDLRKKEYYRKPSEKRVEKLKEKKQTLIKLLENKLFSDYGDLTINRTQLTSIAGQGQET